MGGVCGVVESVMRFPRPEIRDCCVHVTHRCHQRRFLLDTDIDRKQYVKRLWEASRQFRTVRVLDYVVTCNHVLCGAPHRKCYADRLVM